MPDQWEINPSLSDNVAQGGVADEMAGSTYSGAAQSQAAGDVAFGGPTADFILYGVVNGAFAQGPPDPTQNIEPVNNPLPYWSGPTTLSGGSITAQWVVDAASPSGYNLRFTLNPGSATDEAYIEQIVPLGGSRQRWTGHAVRATIYRVTATSATGMAVRVYTQYLTAAGVATGSEPVASVALAADATLYNAGLLADQTDSPPADAQYLRIRVGIFRGGGGSSPGDSGVFDLTDVRVDSARPYLLVAENTTPATYRPALLSQTSGTLQIGPNAATTGVAGTPTLSLNNATGIITATGAIVTTSTIDLGHATDTTLSRSAAGVLSVEGGAGGLQAASLAFPAVDVPSADVNTLDDYEEGAFTPSITFATVGNLNVVYSTQVGTYTKIGRLVNLRIQIATSTFTHTTAAGEFRITGLPFTPVSTFFNQLLMNGWTKANYTYTCGDCQAGITYVRVLASGSGQAVAVFAVGDLPTGGTINIRLGGFFYV